MPNPITSRYPKLMIIAALLLLPAFGWAQTGDHARVMLQGITDSANTLKSWYAEGVEVMALTGNGMQMRDEIQFKIAVESPSKMRWRRRVPIAH